VNLLKRTAVGVIGVPAIYLLIRAGSWFLLALVVAQAGLAAREFYALAGKARPLARAGIILAAAVPLAVFFAVEGRKPEWAVLALLIAVAVSSAAALGAIDSVEGAISRISITGFGIFYLGGLFSLQLFLRQGPAGADWLLLAYLATWCVDIGSYLAGSVLGRHKLSPVLSPGKTWEGAAGGVVFAVAAGWLAGTAVLGLFGPLTAVLYGVAIAVAAPAGDLVESVWKRDAGVKDSSGIIPGHGGILDRFDSLLLTVPVTLVFRFLAE